MWEPNGYGLYDIVKCLGMGPWWIWMYPETATFNPLGAPSDEHSLRGERWGNEPYALRAAKRISVAQVFGMGILDSDWPYARENFIWASSSDAGRQIKANSKCDSFCNIAKRYTKCEFAL